MAAAITTADVRRAARELEGMKRSLAKWLKYRQLNDARAAQLGQRPKHDMVVEQDLAHKLSVLLGTMFPDARLPNADLRSNPSGAVQLVQIALSGSVPAPPAGAPAMAGIGTTHPWLWPVLIVGGLLIAVTTAIKTVGDVAAQKEQDQCIASGACTDYGFWLKWGGIAMLAYVAWNQFGVGTAVKGALARRK